MIFSNFKDTIIPEYRSIFTTSRSTHREVFFEKSCYEILEYITKRRSYNFSQSPRKISVKEFSFRKFVDRQPTALPKTSSFKVFFQGFSLLFYFSLGTPTLSNRFERLLPNFCFTYLFNTNKKKSIN